MEKGGIEKMKKMISVLLSAVMTAAMLPTFAFAENGGFSDVSGNEYYATQAEVLSELAILEGYEDGTFGASRTITRAEMAAIICRMLDKESEAGGRDGQTRFSDVSSNHWASGYINVASSEKIIEGDGNGTFRPEDDVKYEEAIKMVVCALGFDEGLVMDSDDWSAAYLEEAEDKNITEALEGTKGEAATRGDVAVMVYNGLTYDLSAPKASLSEGTYQGIRRITLETGTEGADIYYTMDGTEPTVESTKYAGAITISETCTIKAITVKDDVLMSDVMSVKYTMAPTGGGSGASQPEAYSLSFVSENGTVNTDSGYYEAGSEIDISATPAENYVFVKWESNNGGTFVDANSAATKFTMPSNDVVISAVFERSVEEDLLLNPDETIPGEISRQEWIKQLVDSVGLSMFNTSITSTFEDVDDDNEYLNAIEIALQNGVIPYIESDPKFYPDKHATTAFAAVTAVKALGYEYESTKDCFEIAEECGIFEDVSINDNLVASESERIIDKVLEIIASTEIDTSAPQVMEVGDNTIVLENNNSTPIEYDYEAVSSRSRNESGAEAQIIITKTSETNELLEGECILLPPNEEFPGGLAQKVVGVDNTGNEVILETVTPTLAEFMSDGEIDVQGIQEVDESKFILNEELSDQFDIEYENQDAISLFAGPSINIGDKPKITVKSDSIEVEFSKDVAGSDKVSANGIVEVWFPAVEYNVDLDWFFGVPVGVNELYFALDNKVEATGNIEVTGRKNDIVDGLEIGRIPIPLGASGFTVDIVLWLNVSASGKIELEYSLETTAGVQYTNGRLRTISQCDSNLDFTPLECELEMGPNLSAMLTLFSVFDLADVTASAGVGVNASANIRNSENMCVDGTGYVYLNFSALKNSLIGELTNINGSWVIWDKDNSVFKKSLHFEGTPEHIGLVPSCTFGEGSFSGIVKDSETNEVIHLFQVNCYKTSDGLGFDGSVNISPNGQFVVNDIPSGTYRIEIIADGYRKYEANIRINANQSNDIGIVFLISNDAQNGKGSGIITDALTGNGVSEALVELYSGDPSTGNLIAQTTTSSDGSFSFEQLSGNYTIVVSKSDYTEGTRNFVITASGMTNQNLALIPLGTGEFVEGTISEIGDLRIVLTWGETPADLDSHLCGPMSSGSGRFHVYYRDMVYSNDNNRHCFLDVDDTTSYGPETTTVYDINTSGKYSFYVHDYTNLGSNSSMALSNSGATVKVYVKEATGTSAPNGEELYRAKMIGCFYVPIMTGGTLWHVFDYNAATGELIRKDTMTYHSDVGSVGSINLFAISETSDYNNTALEDMKKIFSSSTEK